MNLGIAELNEHEKIEKARSRKKVGGRKPSIDTIPNIDEKFKEIIYDYTAGDHAHLFISSPPLFSVSKIMQSIKGKTLRKLLSESRELSKN